MINKMSNKDMKSDGFSWIYFLRQILISSGLWSYCFLTGLSYGLPTVYIPQVRRAANASDAITPEMESWLYAVFSYGAIPWYFVMPVVVPLVGSKTTHRVTSIIVFTGHLLAYCSKDIQHVMISLLFQGFIICYTPVCIIVNTEYTSLEYRGLFLTIKSAMFFWGILVSNSIGTFLPWRNITVVGTICATYSFVIVFFYPESPLWLAEKGYFDQCAKAHRWLKGSKVNSELELENLLACHQNGQNNIRVKTQILDMVKILHKKEFYKPMLLGMLLMSLYIFSGKLVCTVYSLDIIRKITKSESTAYADMLILDVVTVLTMYVGCAVTKVLKRRTLLFISALIAVGILYILSLYLFLVNLSIINEDKYISLFLLISYSISVSCGTIILPSTISGELVYLKQRYLSINAIYLYFTITYGSLAKIFPYIVKNLGIHGSFLLFALLSSVCLILIYFYVPETKDKTSQEISKYFSEVEPAEEATELLTVTTPNVTLVNKRNS